MYNRYVRDDGGVYTRVNEESGRREPPRSGGWNGEKSAGDFIHKVLGKLGLDHIDTGDILLLLILFFLFSEKGDEELMTALGLLLIL
ncbi:MAG: hypothetical protein VB112_01810 [Oscillospiraceae bacterium]|nr:hypothetical protein [Oscillospiraceae bacterium]